MKTRTIDKVTAQSDNGIMDADIEHFVTCGVCFSEFDEEIRKPKFLQCAHTVCLTCLQKICQVDSISCPFCRKNFVGVDASSLPNNSYVLHILKLKKKNEKIQPNLDKCQTNKLATALEIRERVQEQLDDVMKTIIAAGEQVKKIQVENSLEMLELISAINSPTTTSISSSSSSDQPATCIFATSTIPVLNQFVLGESSIFILKLLQSGTLKGEIRIRPLPTFHPEFLQQLGKFCYKFPKMFSTTVNKAHAGVFALISVSHLLFRPVVPNFTSSQWPGNPNASPGEVGIILNKSILPGSTLNSSIIASLSLILSINPVNHQHKNLISQVPAEIFGHVIYNSLNQPNEFIMELSKFKKSDLMNYTISIESH